MEFQAYPSPSSLPSPKSDATSSSRIWVERVREVSCDAVSAVIGNLFSAVFTFFFALVGSLLGTMTGALIGQGAESGIFRGAAVGAISGAILSIKVFEFSLLIWDYDNSGFGCVLYLIDVIDSLLSGKLVQDRIAPAMISAIESQMGAGEPIFEEIPSIFEMGGTEGLSRDLVEKIPKIKITAMNYVDTSGERVSCSVCLQDFQLEETVRSLPHCHHMFHLPCIDEWLIRHGSCPLCRREI